jgi:flagellar motor component MotA
MDISVVGGLLFAVAVIVFVGIGPANIMLFVDVPSLGIVIGGTLGQFSLPTQLHRLPLWSRY